MSTSPVCSQAQRGIKHLLPSKQRRLTPSQSLCSRISGFSFRASLAVAASWEVCWAAFEFSFGKNLDKVLHSQCQILVHGGGTQLCLHTSDNTPHHLLVLPRPLSSNQFYYRQKTFASVFSCFSTKSVT